MAPLQPAAAPPPHPHLGGGGMEMVLAPEQQTARQPHPPQAAMMVARMPPHAGPSADDASVVSSCLSDSSHRMALAATAALEQREAEAAKLKRKAQRLLRERSELSCDLEGLQVGARARVHYGKAGARGTPTPKISSTRHYIYQYVKGGCLSCSGAPERISA